MGVEVSEYAEDGVVVFTATITWRDSDLRVTQVTWVNPSGYRWRVAIITPGKADLITIIEPGASGSKNVPAAQGYTIDGPNASGYQVWNIA